MNNNEKWNLRENEWYLLTQLPFFVSFSIALADDIINPEEFTPLTDLLDNINQLNKDDDWLINDIIDDLINILNSDNDQSLLDKLSDALFDNGYIKSVHTFIEYENKDEIFNELNNIASMYGNILKNIEKRNTEMILSFMTNLGFKTAASYGIPNSPVDEKEVFVLINIINSLGGNIGDYITPSIGRLINTDIISKFSNDLIRKNSVQMYEIEEGNEDYDIMHDPYNNGYEEGYEEGFKNGYSEGYEEGFNR